MNFCPLACHFCTDKNSKKLEKIQERAVRFVYDDYSSSPLKLCLKMQRFPPYKWDVSGQWHLRLTKFYTIVCLQNLLHTKNSKYYFRYRNILDVRTTTYGKRSFRFAAASLWNSLPDHFRTENSFAYFRSLVQSWTGSDCRCSACK